MYMHAHYSGYNNGGRVNFTNAHEFVITANRALTKLIPDSANEFTVQSELLNVLFT